MKMDINEIKTWAKNKIESEDLTKQVRSRIKETTWEHQKQREGFRESFKPLISQFEKPEDTKTRNIYTQNQEMLRNQSALTEGLRANQRAITQGFNHFERLADIRELPGVEAIEDGDQGATAEQAIPPKPVNEQFMFNLVNRFKEGEIQKLTEMGYDNPNDFLKKDMDYLESYYKDAYGDIKKMNGQIAGKGKKKNKTQQDKDYIEKLKEDRDLLVTYKDTLDDLIKARKTYKNATGIYTNQLIDRLKLLGGSIMAGNNGVVPEFTQIAKYLNSIKVLPTKELNKMMKKMKIYLGIS